MNNLFKDLGLVEILDLYQIYLQKNADKREYKDVKNNLLLSIIVENNKILNKIINLLERKENLTMHYTLIDKANEMQIKNFSKKTLDKIKVKNYDFYTELEMSLYKDIYGCHFTDWMLEKALDKMKNEDGTTGGHWTLEETNSVAHQYGITFDTFNEYDWNYVMNMIYSDYYGAINNEVSSYVKLAKKFLMDKDGKKGKAFEYYIAMK